jgi:4-nitrophenyl phosphatase
VSNAHVLNRAFCRQVSPLGLACLLDQRIRNAGTSKKNLIGLCVNAFVSTNRASTLTNSRPLGRTRSRSTKMLGSPREMELQVGCESISRNDLFLLAPYRCKHAMEDTDLRDSAELRVQLKHKQSLTHFRELIKPRDCVIVDLDGTLVRGDRPAEGAARFLEGVTGRYMVVSNNSTDTAGRLSAKLGRMGLVVPRYRLVLAGEETIRFVSSRYPGARCLIAASGLLRNMATRVGLMTVTQDAQIVILGRDLRWNYRLLTRLVNEVRRGAMLIVTNADLTHPDGDGRVVPETGSLLAAVVAGAGVAPAHIVGKPEAFLFEEALRRLESAPEKTVVVGDNPSTDQEGARRLGLRCIIVSADRGNRLPNLTELMDGASA